MRIFYDDPRPVTQDWVQHLSYMQQTVLMTAVRGPDGVGKYHPCKYLLRWFRRCVLRCSFGGIVFETPWQEGGGSFTGPSVPNAFVKLPTWLGMEMVIEEYLRSLDELPHHFQMHFLHAAEIIGYKHPDDFIRSWWHKLYDELVRDLHLSMETEEELDARLGDDQSEWAQRSSKATLA